MSWKKISIVIGATIVMLEYDESVDYDRDILSCLISWREFWVKKYVVVVII